MESICHITSNDRKKSVKVCLICAYSYEDKKTIGVTLILLALVIMKILAIL